MWIRLEQVTKPCSCLQCFMTIIRAEVVFLTDRWRAHVLCQADGFSEVFLSRRTVRGFFLCHWWSQVPQAAAIVSSSAGHAHIALALEWQSLGSDGEAEVPRRSRCFSPFSAALAAGGGGCLTHVRLGSSWMLYCLFPGFVIAEG